MSINNDQRKARNLVRYRNGEDFLDTHKVKVSLSFCTALSDTMHVCRKRNGDGTLLTSIWDTKNRLVNLYFYHSYDTTVQFSLAEELAKGDHILDVATLFPVNSEFVRLSNYKTPFNTPELRISLVFVAGVLTILSFLFLVIYLRKRKAEKFHKILMFFSGQNLLISAYLFVLATNINIYYFDAPYKHNSSNLINISSYIPFLLLLSFLPFIVYSVQFIKDNGRKWWFRSILLLNNMIYVAFIIVFGYWGLFDILN